MKYIILFVVIIGILSCKSHDSSKNTDAISSVTTECPEDGNCTFEVLKNQTLSLESDEFGNQYATITEGTGIVLKFEYKRHDVPDVADSSYREQLLLQLDMDDVEKELVNTDLSKVNLLFARLCFCRGQTGYYPITDGKLSISRSSDTDYLLELTFHTDEVPQIINSISESFVLKP